MDFEKDVLTDFESKDVEKNRYFSAFIFLSVFYIIFILFDFLFDLFHGFHVEENINWELVFIVLTPPVIGVILSVRRNKFGWVICLFYNLLMTLMFLVTFLRRFKHKYHSSSDLADGWRGYIILTTVLILVSILVSKSIRYYFKISASDLRATLFLSSVLSLMIIVMLLES